MSETADGFRVPATQNFNTETFAGSVQQVLQDNIGQYVIVDFFMGTGTLETRQGVLYDVATQYIVLYDEINLHYVVCDVFSIKFVTFLLPNYRPGQVPSGSMNGNENLDAAAPSTAMPTMASQPAQRTNISQAAYRYALRRERD